MVAGGDGGAGRCAALRRGTRRIAPPTGASRGSAKRWVPGRCAASGGTAAQQQLAQTLPEASAVVELFGSAATLHNANSSRVGRFLQLEYKATTSGSGGAALRGARLVTYLLERSRVVSVSPGERGFHVFYGLLQS